jgi:hypothetical protein
MFIEYPKSRHTEQVSVLSYSTQSWNISLCSTSSVAADYLMSLLGPGNVMLEIF